MAYRNKFDITGRGSEMGHKAEILFKSMFDKFFSSCSRQATLQEQFNHVDFFCDVRMQIDVKSIKNPECIWIELKNVQGKVGWLYGEATHFAFERQKYFVIVKKEDLIELVDRLVDKEDEVGSNEDCTYKVYSRKKWGRHDLITKIKPEDLKLIPHLLLTKNDCTN